MKNGGAKRLTSCAVAKCDGKPSPMFCDAHRAKLSPEMRARLGRAWWALRGHGTQSAPRGLIDLLVEAVREIQRAPESPEPSLFGGEPQGFLEKKGPGVIILSEPKP